MDLYGKALESYERTMVSVASGALALSITFLHDLTPDPVPSSAFVLWLGWGGLLVSLGVIILSMLVGHWVLERAMAHKSTDWQTKLVTAMNIVSAVALLVGFLGLARFAQVNMFAPKPAAQPTAPASLSKPSPKPPASAP